LAHPLVNLRCAEPVVGWGITAELSPLPSSEHHIVCYFSNVWGLDLILPGALAFLCAPWSIRSRSTLFFFASDGLKGKS